ncbi:MAG: deoxyribonuclease IV [Nitrospirota bacterium]
MRRLGFQTSIAGGIHRAIERARDLGCTTVQIFSHNPRGWTVKGISDTDTDAFKKLREKYNITPVFIHTSYLINLASVNNTLLKKSIDMLVVEMERADAIGAEYVVIHTGSSSGDKPSDARKRAIEALNVVASRGSWKAGLLIENTAGERGDISSSIKEMAEIINAVKGTLISGICIDTCHAFSAGYDISKDNGIEMIAREIKEHIRIENLKLIHLNDSKAGCGSGIDRHEHIGKGKIGMKGLASFINYPPFKDIPLILETPKKTEDDDRMNLERAMSMLR